jgi:hypothetical protein
VANDEQDPLRADARGYEGMERIADWWTRLSLHEAPMSGNYISFAEIRTVPMNGGIGGEAIVRVDLRVGFMDACLSRFFEEAELSEEFLFIDVLRFALPDPPMKPCWRFALSIESRATRTEPVLVFRTEDGSFEVHAMEMYRGRTASDPRGIREWPKPVEG